MASNRLTKHRIIMTATYFIEHAYAYPSDAYVRLYRFDEVGFDHKHSISNWPKSCSMSHKFTWMSREFCFYMHTSLSLWAKHICCWPHTVHKCEYDGDDAISWIIYFQLCNCALSFYFHNWIYLFTRNDKLHMVRFHIKLDHIYDNTEILSWSTHSVVTDPLKRV